ncbi:MAG TPA: hypothetical protein VE177_08045 [Candidatus Binatus sp.]|nr:hypothetical protein [Candidatus Binatus sp.]
MTQNTQLGSNKQVSNTSGVTVKVLCYNCRREHPVNCMDPANPVRTCTPITDPSGLIRGIHHQCQYCGFGWNEWKTSVATGH